MTGDCHSVHGVTGESLGEEVTAGECCSDSGGKLVSVEPYLHSEGGGPGLLLFVLVAPFGSVDAQIPAQRSWLC